MLQSAHSNSTFSTPENNTETLQIIPTMYIVHTAVGLLSNSCTDSTKSTLHFVCLLG